MSTDVFVAICAAGISAIAAGVAVWQALVAKRQARTAEDSALSARRQADAAEKQVQLMQRQIDGEEAERHDANGPRFKLGCGWLERDQGGAPRATLSLRHEAGLALSSVRVTVTGQYIEGVRPDPDEIAALPSLDLGESSAGAELTFCVGIDDRFVSPVQVAVHIESKARDSTSTWTRDLALSTEPRPEGLRSIRRRSVSS
ncbi:hypothetical protein ACFUJR_37760 [Streptomyces sp. NPDC057271]|uniref:hypothetical protein n=1 Tax=unclassified Streptomyces TaxID=2593676 RepID=UPI0036395F81